MPHTDAWKESVPMLITVMPRARNDPFGPIESVGGFTRDAGVIVGGVGVTMEVTDAWQVEVATVEDASVA